MEGKVCSKCGVWKPLEEYHKDKRHKDGMQSACRKCQNERRKKHYQNNKEYYKEYGKQYRESNKVKIKEYYKQWREDNKEYKKEYNRQHYENNKEHYKEINKQYREVNKEYLKEKHKQYCENNKEHIKEYKKQYRRDNKEYIKERDKQYRESTKQNNLQYISNLLEQINPTFKQFKLPVYGYVYKFENTKTGRCYIGQTITPLKHRYKTGIVKGWIKERLEKVKRKFTEELIEEDFVVTEVLDVAFCQYHLDKLEVYYINKYNSFLNGYNNQAGKHDTDDGIEEFNQILAENNLEFIDGKLVKIA